jgi:hypothetical protein
MDRQEAGRRWLRGGAFAPAVAALLAWSTPGLAQTSPCNRLELERNFTPRFNAINRHIREKQTSIDRLLATNAPDGEIKDMTRELIRWRAKRDNLAIEYILRMRREECPYMNIDQRAR